MAAKALSELTPQRRAEQQLRKTEELLRLLISTVEDYAIFILDPEGIVTTWNVGAEKIKGYSADEIIGKHFSVFYTENEVRSGKCELELERAARDGRFEDEGFRLRKDGSRFWANVVITALFDEQRNLVGFAKVTRDLTERRRAEQERLRLAQAHDANRAKDEFLGMVSHELRTPLNAILGWATLLLRRATDAEMVKGLETIKRNAETQAKIVDDVLDVSRMITGKVKLELKSIDMVTVLREAVEAIRPTAETKRIGIAEDFVDSAPIVGDPVRLQQVVWNLLSNAVKFTEPGGSVEVQLELEGPNLVLSVRDTGPGIDPEFLPHVFERFRQADSSTRRRHGGLGLGLAIVREIVELHGGGVSAESPGRNQGARFSVRLPLRAASVGSDTPA